MGWWICVQPNRKYARFSTVVDDFTHVDMSRAEALEVCRRAPGVGRYEAEEMVRHAELEPERWEQGLAITEAVHGKYKAEARRQGAQ